MSNLSRPHARARKSERTFRGDAPLLAPVLIVPWALTLALGLSIQARAAAGFDFDKAPGRLPKTIVPLDYTVTVTPDVKAKTFTGKETVKLRFRKAGDTVVFNTLNLVLRDVALDGKPVAKVATDDKAQLTTLTLGAPAAVGEHTLTLSYTGKIETSPQGMFLQSYGNPDGSTGLMLTTQMEPSDARRLLPCWDEPSFRATFQLTAVLPAGWAAVGNMPVDKRVVQGALATTSFKRSPKMPSYLVELTAGDVAEVSGEQDGVGLGVWAVKGHEAEGTVALANAKQILADYDEYFGYKFPLPKLDSIAIPGGFSGAMENWGAITYTSQALLLDKTSSVGNEQEVFSTQAHEMAHQWNGDLVTMSWWDDLWLNESFASWRAAKEADMRHPEWKWWEGQDGDKESAMYADAKSSSVSIQRHVTNELEAGSAFDPVITYSKGQAVLRMFEAYLGPDVFRDGIRAYMKARAFGNATTGDLWNALSAQSHQDIGAIASGWTEQAGFPLVSVKASCDSAGARTISLTQSRFLLEGTAPDSHAHWQVPLQIRAGAEAPKTVLLTQDGQTVSAGSCQEPLSVNAGAIGYFRAQYDAATLAVNTRAFGSLPDADRIALLDDQWALVDAGKAPLESFLALASGMRGNLNAVAWERIIGGLSTIERYERGTPGHDAFVAYARSILKTPSDQLGWEPRPGENQATRHLRRSLIDHLGGWGDTAILAEARKHFAAFEHDPAAIAPDDRGLILALVGAYADAGTFERIHTLAKQAKTESDRERLYNALASVRDPQLASQAAAIATGPELPPQALQMRFGMLHELHEYHVQQAWDAFSPHAQELMSPAGALAPLFLAQYVPEWFWDSLPPAALEAWLKAHTPPEMASNVARGMEGARFRVHEKAMLVPAADAYLASRGHINAAP